MWSKSNKFDQEKESWQKLEVSTNWGGGENKYLYYFKQDENKTKKSQGDKINLKVWHTWLRLSDAIFII